MEVFLEKTVQIYPILDGNVSRRPKYYIPGNKMCHFSWNPQISTI